MRALVLVALALLCLGFEWEGRLGRLERQLESGDPRQRREVVRLMASYPASEVREPLLRALRDRDPAVRREAAETAGRVRLTDAVPLLLDWLEDEDADVRAGAAAALGHIGDARAIASLVRALGDASSDVRRAAVRALGDLEEDAVVVPLLGRLDDDDPEVRAEAAQVLATLGDARAVVPLVGRGRDESPVVRQAVYEALGALADARAAAALVQSLRDEAEPAKLAAIAALGRLGAERGVDPLVELLRDRDARASRAAVSALGAIGSESALRAVIDALAIRELRETSMQVLATHDAERLTAMLGSALETTRNPEQATAIGTVLARRLEDASAPAVGSAIASALDAGRGQATVLLAALARSGDPDVLVTLLEYLRRDDATRRAALEALDEYFRRHPADGRAADPLLAILGEVAPADRVTVVRLLGRVGASRALGVIRPLLSHADPALRLAAVEAIGAIGDPTGAEPLLELLDAREPRLRFEAAHALGDAASPDVVSTLLERLASREPVDRHAVLIALGGSLAHVELENATDERVAARLESIARGPDDALAARAIETLGRWASPRSDRLLTDLAESTHRATALRALRSPEPLRAALREGTPRARLAAAARLGEIGGAEDLPQLVEAISDGRWPIPAAASWAVARLARRDVHAGPDRLCPLLRSRDAYVRANLIVALTAGGVRCPERLPSDLMERAHAAPVRAAAALWLRRVDRTPAARATLSRCVSEELAPEVARACETTELPALDRMADIYAYASDGTTLLRDHLIAIRFEDGSALLVETDANAHVRWEATSRGRILLDDPLRTPLQP